MSQTLTRTYPDEWVTRMLPAVVARAEAVEGHRVVQFILEARGGTPDADGIYQVDDLTPMQKAELLVDLQFWDIVKRYEILVAEQLAKEAAIAALSDPIDGDV